MLARHHDRERDFMSQSGGSNPLRNMNAGTAPKWHDVRRGVQFALITAPLSLIWEIAHLPLYTIWWDQPLRDSLTAAVHCTFGDVALAFGCFMIASVFIRFMNLTKTNLMFGGLAIALSVTATAILEVLSTQVLSRWSYAPAMPILPLLGIGLSPMLQWIFVPTMALVLLARVSKPRHPT
jgi:hypothetical protein